jgi:hypothetical protein
VAILLVPGALAKKEKFGLWNKFFFRCKSVGGANRHDARPHSPALIFDVNFHIVEWQVVGRRVGEF